MPSHSSIIRHSIRGVLAATILNAVVIAGAAAGDSKVKLTGQEETPPVTTAASGVAEIHVGADRTVSGVVQTSGVDGTAAHIHQGAAGEKGPPVVTLEKGADGKWTVPQGTTLNDEQYAAYQSGKLYVNVHSAANKGGEIRGQLKP